MRWLNRRTETWDTGYVSSASPMAGKRHLLVADTTVDATLHLVSKAFVRKVRKTRRKKK